LEPTKIRFQLFVETALGITTNLCPLSKAAVLVNAAWISVLAYEVVRLL
jgi:hypothetical protein